MTDDPLRILTGDCRETMSQIPDGTVQTCVTSPPYWGLRSYLPAGHTDKHREIGSEPTPEAFVETMVEVFREVRRCLHESGTLWLNLGDSYAATHQGKQGSNHSKAFHATGDSYVENVTGKRRERDCIPDGLKPKDLCMIPWRVALALQADGWWLRSVICWHKKSCMPESVTDRPTNSWEPIFLLAKSARYFYDAEAVKEPSTGQDGAAADFKRTTKDHLKPGHSSIEHRMERESRQDNGTRNQRNVWTLGPEPYSEAHFATFPTEIPRRAILAGTSARGCCPKCCAPWVRVVEKESKQEQKEWTGSGRKNGCMAGGGHEGRTGQWTAESITVGWNPSCECDEQPIQQTVLDPFGGSGTTGQVALELARRAILCELNPEYAKLIERRTDVTPGLALH